MEIQVTNDLDFATALMKHPAIWPSLTNDNVPSDFRAPDNYLYLVALDPHPIGLFSVKAWDQETVSAHAAMLPAHRGAKTLEAGRLVLKWIWTNSRASRVVVRYEDGNQKARAGAKRLGFVECGRSVGAVLKQGRLIDLIEMEIHRCRN